MKSQRLTAPLVHVSVLLLMRLVSGGTMAAADIHVSVLGNDAHSGTRLEPFATLERAHREARKIRNNGQLPAEGVTIWLEAGDYVRTNTLELSAADSGSPDAPIVWRAVEGARVRLLGGRRIANWTRVTNAAVLTRFPDHARSLVMQADLRALEISEFGEMKSRGFSRPTVPAGCELFYDGRPMTLARWPNEGGWARIAGFPEDTAQDDGHRGRIGKLENGFLYDGDRPRSWKDRSDVWVHGYWAWDWANSYERLASIDLDRRCITALPPHGLYGFRKGQRFYFVNILEELDQPGEWFLDRSDGVVYFWPPKPLSGAGDDPEVLLSTLAQPLVLAAGVSHCVIQGFILEATRGNAVEFRGGAGNLVAGCTIRNAGNWGVKILGGAGHGVKSCDIIDTGDGGVHLQGGDRQTLVPGGHFVENCHFVRQGRWSKCYVPSVQMDGVGMRASSNRIQDHPHCGILFNGNDHLIEFNEIHHIALETGDVGAIYTGRDYTYRGNRIRHNFIHHTGGVGMGSMGVYMDDCVSGTEIYGNVFYKVQRAAFLGGGRDHEVINNIFVDCDHAVELDGRGLDRSPVWRQMVDTTMRERLAAVPADLYRARYPALRSLDRHYGPPQGPAITGEAFKGVPPEDNLVARNLCVGKWLNVYWHGTASGLRLESNLTNAMASFMTTPQGDKALDFAIRTNSPAAATGFVTIPLHRIGLQQDALRRALPR